MYKRLQKYLREPYPYYYNNTKKIVFLLLLVCVLSFSFSYFFEPFDVNITEHKINSIWILFLHAFIPLPIGFVYFSLLNRTLNEGTNWTLKKELLNLSIILLIVGIVSFLIRDIIYINSNNWSVRYFWEEIRNTFLVGILLLILLLPLNLERLIKKHSTSLMRLSITSSKVTSKIIAIKTPIKNECFELNIKDFIFAKVESNYIEIYTFSFGEVQKKLIRMPLKELQDQLEEFTYIFKTHRSYLINTHAIESISGNAQGYQLRLKKCSTTIPVSRSNIAVFNKMYTNK